MNTAAEEFIAAKRALLDSLERFTRTDQYRRLLTLVEGAEVGLPESWLVEWLISPAFGLGALPIDVAAEPDGMDQLEAVIRRIAFNAGA